MISHIGQFLVRTLMVGVLLVSGWAGRPAAEEQGADVSPAPRQEEVVRLTSDQAVAVALNDLEVTAGGYRLSHPQHTASFTAQGVTFTPKRGGPAWNWQLTGVFAFGGKLKTRRLPYATQIAFRPNAKHLRSFGQSGKGHEQVLWAKTASLPVLCGCPSFFCPKIRTYPQLTAVGAGDRSLAGAWLGAVDPLSTGASVVAYERGVLVEQYLARGSSVEQQFVIPQPLRLGGADLVIEGAVQSTGQFEEAEDGWSWRAGTGAVHLGHVRVIDAAGEDLPATMQVTASATRITVDGPALAGAAYPVTIDPEIGANDFRISDMGGDIDYDAQTPDVAYNSTDNEYLVVWSGDDNTRDLVDEEFEIYGQRVDAATGEEIGEDVRLSDMGDDGDPDYDAHDPAVAYNSTRNEYFVVWSGDNFLITGQAKDEFEIYGQRVDGATGTRVGVNDRLSDMGPNWDTGYGAYTPDVAYNSTDNEYLVVWRGDDNTAPLVDDEFEIYRQRVDGTSGAEIGLNDLRLSDMGPDGDPDYDAASPAVAYNSTRNEYLVVWSGDNDTGDLVDEEFEIYGQRVDGGSDNEIGADVRLSDMGSSGDTDCGAYAPDVAYNSTDNEYLVVWEGTDDTPPLSSSEYEIFAQRVDGTSGAEIGLNDHRLSDMGPDGDSDYSAHDPAVAYNSTVNEYLVVWRGFDYLPPQIGGEREIYGQRVVGGGDDEIGGNDVRLSDMGPDGDNAYLAYAPAVAYNGTDNEHLVVWQGTDNTGALVSNEYEIFAQRVDGITGAEVGANDVRLSDMGGDLDYGAFSPDVAYNSTDNEYLVVWSGTDNTGALVAGESEIYGQRVDGATGAEIGGDLRLSDMGPDGNPDYDASSPSVAYNSTENEYLVVWSGDDNTGALVDDESEIYAQRVAGATGAEIGTDHRLSDMGPDGNPDYDAYDPAVAYNSTRNEYLVVWKGDDNTGDLVDNEFEIYGQRVTGDGVEIGADVRLSDMGPDGNPNYDASDPAVAYNSTSNEYLVVWSGDNNTGGLVDDEFEVYGQRVDGASGAEVGTNDFRLSDMGPDGDTDYGAVYPAVAYNSTDNEYLVVWHGDDNRASLVNGECEIFGQRVVGTGEEIGLNDVRLSNMGPDGDINYDALRPDVAYNDADNEYLVAWYGNDDAAPLADNEFEIYGQRVAGATGAEVWGDVRLSDMGPDGIPDYDATYPAVAYNSTDNEYLAVWEGDDNTRSLVNDEYEIFGQRFRSVELIVGLVATSSGETILGHPTTLTATITAGTEVSYTWDLGDDSWAYGAVVSHTYLAAGFYTVTVTASNSANASTASTMVTIVNEEQAIAGLVASSDSPTTLGQATHLTATVTAGSNVSYTWAFGDGGSGDGAVVTYTYATAGIYTAVVTASNSISSSIATTQVTVTEESGYVVYLPLVVRGD